jgi:hypothetical protein
MIGLSLLEKIWKTSCSIIVPIGSMDAIYGNMDPINIPPMLAYIPAPWILWGMQGKDGTEKKGWSQWFPVDLPY